MPCESFGVRISTTCGALIRNALRRGLHTPGWNWLPTFGCVGLLRLWRRVFGTMEVQPLHPRLEFWALSLHRRIGVELGIS